MKIGIDSIQISGFMDIGENQYIDLSGKSLYAILGHNEDTGSSNGSGKSTFINAVYVGILGPTFFSLTMKEMKNRYLDIFPRLITALSIDDDKLIIDRTIGGKLLLKFNNEEVQDGKSDDLQKKIFQYLGVNQEQLLQLTYKSQGGSSFFLLMKDSEKKDFLGSLLDLSSIESLHEEIRSETSKIKLALINSLAGSEAYRKEADQYKIKIQENEIKLSHLHSLPVFLKTKADNEELDRCIEESDLKILSIPLLHEVKQACLDLEQKKHVAAEEVAALESVSALLKSTILKSKELLQNPLVLSDSIQNLKYLLNIKTQDFSRNTEHNKLIKLQIDEKNKIVVNTRNGIQLLESKLQSLVTQKNALEANKCFECGQQYHNDDLTKKINSNSLKIKEIEETLIKTNDTILQALEDIDSANGSFVSLEVIKAEESDIQEKKEQITKELIELSMGRKLLESQLKTQELELQNTTRSASDIIASVDTGAKEFESFISGLKKSQLDLIESYKKKKKDNEALLHATEREIEMTSREIGTLSVFIEKSTDNLKKEESVSNLLYGEIEINEKIEKITSKDGFIGYLFDDFLYHINKNANINLKKIPLTSSMSLILSPDKEIKSTKKISKSISYSLMVDDSVISFESLSGAEKLCVLMAVEEAIDKVVSNRIGTNLGWKFLDEQLMYVDAQNKEAVIDFLKDQSFEKSYFIVDHTAEFNAAFEKSISIVKKNGIATLSLHS